MRLLALLLPQPVAGWHSPFTRRYRATQAVHTPGDAAHFRQFFTVHFRHLLSTGAYPSAQVLQAPLLRHARQPEWTGLLVHSVQSPVAFDL